MRALAVVGAALAIAVAPASASPSVARINLPQLARSLVKAGAPGAIVYVRTPKRARAGAAGFADLSGHVAMRAADRYRIASLTKTFVAVVILQLEAEGRLRIDDPVDRWLPGLVPNGAAITLRELLNHTSGLFDYTEDPAFGDALLAAPTRTWTPRELLPYAFAHPPFFAPGTNWHYSNTNFILLGLVAEAVANKPLGELLQERIFTPLGLASTSFPIGIEIDGTFAHGYLSLNGSPLIDVTPAYSPTSAWAAGGIVSNAGDVTAFYRALLNGKLLPAAQLKEMKTIAPVAGTYGLGIDSTITRCGRAFGHRGDFTAWRNQVLATANGKREAVVMVNVDQTHVDWAQIDRDVELALCRG
jgi:D-alanyl-D-alanine carboxypeptidase